MKEKQNCRTGYCPTLISPLSSRASIYPPTRSRRRRRRPAGVDSRCRHSHEMLVTLGGSPKRAHEAYMVPQKYRVEMIPHKQELQITEESVLLPNLNTLLVGNLILEEQIQSIRFLPHMCYPVKSDFPLLFGRRVQCRKECQDCLSDSSVRRSGL